VGQMHQCRWGLCWEIVDLCPVPPISVCSSSMPFPADGCLGKFCICCLLLQVSCLSWLSIWIWWRFITPKTRALSELLCIYKTENRVLHRLRCENYRSNIISNNFDSNSSMSYSPQSNFPEQLLKRPTHTNRNVRFQLKIKYFKLMGNGLQKVLSLECTCIHFH
jgi:hypothetical protein